MRTLNSQNKEERRGHREEKRKKTQEENKYKDKKINNLSCLREKRINQKLKGEYKFIQLFILVKVYIYNY